MVNVSPIIEPGGETSGAVAVFSDVTEMKKLDTAKSMFVSLVAHEVKSPLAATEGWLNLILSGMLKHDAAEEHRMLQRALLRVRTLRGMVNELLSLTAIQTGQLLPEEAPVDVAAVVAEVVEANREKAAEKRHHRVVRRCRRGARVGAMRARRPGRSCPWCMPTSWRTPSSTAATRAMSRDASGDRGCTSPCRCRTTGSGSPRGGLREGFRRVLPVRGRA